MTEQTQSQAQPSPEELEQAFQQWQREMFQRAQSYLADKGVIADVVLDKECRLLPPLCAVWKMKATNGKRYWVLTGRLPSDHAEVSAADTARDALRYFSLQWQLKADELMASGLKEKAQLDFANLLVNRAHGLYEMYERDDLWTNAQA